MKYERLNVYANGGTRRVMLQNGRTLVGKLELARGVAIVTESDNRDKYPYMPPTAWEIPTSEVAAVGMDAS